ncbi:HD domain-containing protein [Candidatus Riflebacteria bacterium]
MDRLEKLRNIIDRILFEQTDDELRRCGFIHLYGVSDFCNLLALRRKLKQQICAAAGMLHDIATYKTGEATDHAKCGSLIAKQILTETGLYSAAEISIITVAIKNHSNKLTVDDEYSELLKDADVMQFYFYNPGMGVSAERKERLEKIIIELGAA